MHAGYQVHPEALRTYASRIDAAAGRVSTIMSALSGTRVPDQAFGKLPDAHGLASAYEEHAEADVQDCRDLHDILQDTADGLRTTADSYDDTETVTVSALQEVKR
ncbi:WXG100 family type VII secretion target [Streptomyces sp. NPDC059740]|uniref:WXG100 family type VII secretion target n=1 Tax=Streptomyces sp. NPDC059740 TaxID=3346926 RepID=UPI00366A20DB